VKIYVKTEEHAYVYPADMALITNHLARNGALFATGPTVEQMYSKFSEDRYAAGWMSVTPEILEEFADWLAAIEI